MSNPISVPGTVVPSGSLISPGGAQGLQGIQGTTALATTTQNGLLRQVSGNTTDFIDGTNNSQPLQPVIWSATRRVFNAVGNPTFEVDQRNVGTAVTMTAGPSAWGQDRWLAQQTAGITATATYQRISGLVSIPNTNFSITQNFARITLTANQGAVASGYLRIFQSIEGICLRELISDVHSIQVLVRSSVAPLSFSIALQNPSSTWSLTLLATISTANTWTLLTLPNIPIFTGNVSWTTGPGTGGYFLYITLAAYSSYQSPTNGVWASGSFLISPGQSNFVASPVNSTFDIAFIQHEPGPLCTTPIDCPFTQNYDDCLRYFQKTYDYGVAPGAVNSNGINLFVQQVATSMNPTAPISFKKTMAKVPTVIAYSPNTGAANAIYDVNTPAQRTVTGYSNVGQSGYGGVVLSSFAPTAANYLWQHTADTGW